MAPASTPYAFHQLVADLSSTLGSSSLNSKDVDLEKLTSLMEKYVSREGDWKKYAFMDTSIGYTRNLVDEGNGKSNLLVLVWTPGKGSPIHDHANAHCLMKILKGTLHETHYAYPSKTGSTPTITKDFVHRENAVAYMSDELGVHRISNQDPKEFAVSLHLYTPPNARHKGCHIFNEKTGEKRHIPQFTFFSEFGHKVTEATEL